VRIVFCSDSDRELFNDDRALRARYGAPAQKQARRRLDDLLAASNLEVMRMLPGRCHELKGDRKGQLAVEVGRAKRLIFEPAEDPPPAKNDGGLDWPQVVAIRILSIEDYHD